LGLASILLYGTKSQSYPEAINIVIEELENQPMIDEVEDDITNMCESVE
jgi:hypothetical protein